MRAKAERRGFVRSVLVLTGVGIAVLLGFARGARAQTALGEIEARPAAIALRRCVGGASVGVLCRQNSDCPGSTCVDRNIINLSVAVQFNATAAELTSIRNMISAASSTMLDATDGQAQIGSATIHNNALGTTADVRIYPVTNDTWWATDTGLWKVGGASHVSINYVQAATAPGESLAHELTHLIFDARDEYEARAAGCGGLTGAADCPNAATVGETSCIMDDGGIGAEGTHTEYCWGHGDPLNLMSIATGNHDATAITEQSSCRSGRSCWDQVVWSFPSTIIKPTAAPDPGTNGRTLIPTSFLTTNNTQRVVLVLDESGSMSLDAPSRMERLKVAAKEFVSLAETGTELGIVSFSNDASSSSGRVNVNITALGGVRTAWTNAIDGMAPFAATNIGAGLQKARDMITTAGGVTANTFIVLMTDGLNNQPPPLSTAAADLAAKVAMLMADGIPVYVTCTGSDLGLESQCAEIAAGTGGWYVDSAQSSDLQASMVHLKELVSRRQAVASSVGTLKAGLSRTVYVEKGSESTTFALVWTNAASLGFLTVIDPNGVVYDPQSIPQGQFVRVTNPVEGNWQVRIAGQGQDGPFKLQVFSRNRDQSMSLGLRRASVAPGEPLHLYAMPRSYGGAISHPVQFMTAQVTRPDGTTEVIQLSDRGRAATSQVDDMADDGVFSGVYLNTNLKGAYTFAVTLNEQGWFQSGDIPASKRNPSLQSPRLSREVTISGAVAIKGEIDPTLDDDTGVCPQGCLRTTPCVPGKFVPAPACSATCPNGAPASNGQCLIPTDAQGSASCVNTATNCPPGGSASIDCRIYNQEARQANGQICRNSQDQLLCQVAFCTASAGASVPALGSYRVLLVLAFMLLLGGFAVSYRLKRRA